MKNEIKNFGYIPPTLDLTNDYFAGVLPKDVINTIGLIYKS